MRLERKALIVSVLALAMLGLAVVPGLTAPEKQFTIVAPTSVSANATTIPVTVHNTTPNGNSNISSLTLTGVGAGLVITAVSPGTGSGFGDGSININSISPIKPGKSTTFNLTVTNTVGGCSDGIINWTARAFTGNSLGGDEFNFRIYPTPTTPTPVTNFSTTVATNCALSIDPISSGIKGENVSITARVGSGGSSDFTGNIALDVDGPNGFTFNQTKAAVAGAATFSVNVTEFGDYDVTASATGYADATASFEVFNDGITCNGQSPQQNGGGTTSQLFRTDAGPASGCIDVPYTLTSDEDLVILLKDQAILDQQGAEFKLVITWGLSAGDYPNFGETTFDLDGNFSSGGDQFVPDDCDVVGSVPQVPVNPDGNGNHWPAGTAEQPWCHAGSSIVPFGTGYQVTETFLGAGDPNIVRNR